jgi:hypothetical protein
MQSSGGVNMPNEFVHPALTKMKTEVAEIQGKPDLNYGWGEMN